MRIAPERSRSDRLPPCGRGTRIVAVERVVRLAPRKRPTRHPDREGSLGGSVIRRRSGFQAPRGLGQPREASRSRAQQDGCVTLETRMWNAPARVASSEAVFPWKRHSGSVGRRVSRPTVSAWLVVLACVVVAFAFGLRFWALVVALIAVVMSAVGGAISDRAKEWFERKPDLRLFVGQGGELRTTVTARLPPWPFDLERVVLNEVGRLEEEARAYEKMAR